MVASLAEIVIGATGLPGLLMKYIGPITIAPTVAMVGMGLWKAAANTASSNWIVALMYVNVVYSFTISFFSIQLNTFNLYIKV